jgi:hypothetical protein
VKTEQTSKIAKRREGSIRKRLGKLQEKKKLVACLSSFIVKK